MNFNNPNEGNFAFSLLLAWATILYIMYTLVHLCLDIFIYIYISFTPHYALHLFEDLGVHLMTGI